MKDNIWRQNEHIIGATEIFFFTSVFVLNFLVYQSFHFNLLSNLFCFEQTFQSLSQQTNISEF
jgi:hypothetical protein